MRPFGQSADYIANAHYLSSDKAIAMEQRVHYYPRASLQLEEDAPGARMWGVALEKTELTYFEVDPHSRFDWHRHESEQITVVLEGVLFFEVGDTTYTVEAGDVLAIPSNVLHAAFTKEKAVKAIDAWSPVLRDYLAQS